MSTRISIDFGSAPTAPATPDPAPPPRGRRKRPAALAVGLKMETLGTVVLKDANGKPVPQHLHPQFSPRPQLLAAISLLKLTCRQWSGAKLDADLMRRSFDLKFAIQALERNIPHEICPACNGAGVGCTICGWRGYVSQSLRDRRRVRRSMRQQLIAEVTAPLKQRPKSFAGETNDCCVHALSFAVGVPYAVAHKALCAAGRKERQGTRIEAALAHPSVTELARFTQVRTFGNVTLGTLLGRLNPDCRYLVSTRRHALAVVGGRIQDHTANPPSMRIWRCWVVEPTTRKREVAI